MRDPVKRTKDIVSLLRQIHHSKQTADIPALVELSVADLKACQDKDELAELTETVGRLRPAAAMEIGTRTGGTLFLLCRVSAPSASIISVDLPGGRFGGGYAPRRRLLYQSFASSGQSLHLLRLDSHKPETLDRVVKILRGVPLDYLFIDGDHTYGGVKQDFEMYSSLVRKGGLIAFHDIATSGAARACEVPRFWHEISQHHLHKELITEPSGFGIGLLWL